MYKEAVNMEKQLMTMENVIMKKYSKAAKLSDAAKYFIDLERNENLKSCVKTIHKKI